MASLSSSPRAALAQLFRATIDRLEPGARVANGLRDSQWSARQAVVLAVGKGAYSMYTGACDWFAEHGIELVHSVVVVPAGQCRPMHGPHNRRLQVFESSHPQPDQRAVRAAGGLLDAVRSPPPGAEILALISGGGSALAALPADRLTLAEKVQVTSTLAERGATIVELNTVRKHLSAIKGGRLAAAAGGTLTTLVVSDVVGDDLAVVASGPTVADPTSFADTWAVIDRWLDWSEVPPAVIRLLQRGRAGEIAETPTVMRSGDRIHLIAGTDTLLHAAARVARSAGMRTRIVARKVVGDIGAVADMLLGHARDLAAGQPGSPACFIAGGEPTLSLPSVIGSGGRAQQLALLIARGLAHDGRDWGDLSVLIAGSDGIDGNSDAAGAIVDAGTWHALTADGVDGVRALRQCDAGRALSAVGATLVTGPTGVNHADLMVLTAGTRHRE